MKYRITLCIILMSLFSLTAQEKDLVEWKDLQQADSLHLQGDKRPLFVNIYTDWCGYCRLMDKSTFHDEEVADYINKNFIPVKFNAESKEDVTFKGVTYPWVSGGRNGIQSLAYYLLGGQLSYPSVPIVDTYGETLTVIKGFIKADDFLSIMQDIKKQIDNLAKEEI